MAKSNPIRETQPGLAIVANCVTPYRVHLHRLVASGIPELKLHTLITHGGADFDWSIEAPAEIHLTNLGSPNDSAFRRPWSAPLAEWHKGGQIIRYLEENNVRAVVCPLPRYISYLRVVAHCRRADIPLFVRSDANVRSEKPLPPFQQAVKARFYAWWLKRIAGLMPMGEYGKQYFEKYGFDRRRMYLVPYTPDYDFYAAVDPQQVDRLREKYGLRRERKYFVFSGRLAPVKRVDLLIDAFARLADQRPDWDLILVGDGPSRQTLEQQIPEKLRSRIVWTGFLDHGEPALVYHAADVLVLPSDREPWALVVQEAMAAGLTVVASDVVGAAQEMVKDGESGRIFPAGDAKALAQAMLDTSQPDQLKTYRRQAREALKNWRTDVDPVTEIRRALATEGVLVGQLPMRNVQAPISK
jgi:glycosyltransferase involved in cell wall biosynthesis